MNNIYHISLDFRNAGLREAVLKSILEAPFMRKVCVTEESGFSNRLFSDVPGNLVIFDDRPGIEAYCSRKLKQSPTTLFIHLGEKPERNDSLHLIGMTPAFMKENFLELLSICYMIHLVRLSISNVQGMIKGVS